MDDATPRVTAYRLASRARRAEINGDLAEAESLWSHAAAWFRGCGMQWQGKECQINQQRCRYDKEKQLAKG